MTLQAEQLTRRLIDGLRTHRGLPVPEDGVYDLVRSVASQLLDGKSVGLSSTGSTLVVGLRHRVGKEERFELYVCEIRERGDVRVEPCSACGR